MSETESRARRTRTAPGSVRPASAGAVGRSEAICARIVLTGREDGGGAAGGRREGDGAVEQPERLGQDADDLEQDLDELGGDIDAAREGLRARQADADVLGDIGGEWHDTDDEGTGEDPLAFDDPAGLDPEHEDI